MTSFYDRHVLPWLLGAACASKPIMKQRAKVVPFAEGRVLELGLGSGLNLPFYDAAKVTSLEAVEPSKGLRDKAMAAGEAAAIPTHIEIGRAHV